MRKCLYVITSILSINYVVANEFEPKVYSEVSTEAQHDAVAFNGTKLLAGLLFHSNRYQACTDTNNTLSKIPMRSFGIVLGMEYLHKFKYDLLGGVDVSTSIWKKSKKTKTWNELNAAYISDYNAQHGERLDGNTKGHLETSSFTPSISLKVGYAFAEYQTSAFIKAGASKLSGKYYYTDKSNLSVSKFVPFIGVGIERKINSKLGASLEASFSLKKDLQKELNNIHHKIKLNRSAIQIMGIYSIPKK